LRATRQATDCGCSFSDPVNTTPPADCRHCGVCCFSQKPDYVRVTGDDWARLGEDAERLAYFLDTRAFMRMTDGHCAALAIRRMPDGAARFFCTSYARRPQICRDLARGSGECLGELAAKGERVTAIAIERE
jgi:uncharacterized protein